MTGFLVRTLSLLLVLYATGCATTSVLSQNWTAPTDPLAAYPLTKLEQRLIDDSQDRFLSQMSLLEAAVIASGATSQEEVDSVVGKLQAQLQPIQTRVSQIKDQKQRGQALLRALHEDVFGEYKETATTLLDLTQRNQYNCVVATLLYNYSAQQVGLIVKAVIIPSHVYSLVFSSSGVAEVETTSPNGFDPDRSSRAYLSFLAERGLSRSHLAMGQEGDSSGETQLAVEIDNLTLVSLILSNRGLNAFDSGKPALAYSLFSRSHKIAEQERADQLRAHEASIVNGMALKAAEQKRFDHAIRLLDTAIPEAPPSQREILLHNRMYCVERKVFALADSGNYQEAVGEVDRAVAVDPDDENVHGLRVALYNRWALGLAEDGQVKQAVQVFERALLAEPGTGVLSRNLAIVLYNQAVEQINAGNCSAALPTIARGEALEVEGISFAELRGHCVRSDR